MPSLPEHPRTAILVLAAGASRRLGRPKQLLPYRGGVLLDAALATARASGCDQIILALGGAADQVRERVDTSGCDVVENADYGTGCSSSIAAALPALNPGTGALVLLLADQPGTTVESVHLLRAGLPGHELAVCRYDDGVGHPFAFSSSLFPDLATLHGDKAVWKLLENWRIHRPQDIAEVPVPGRIPLDVDTEADYEQLLAAPEGLR